MPKETKLILKHADEAGYTNGIQCYLKHGGYKTLKKAFRLKPKKRGNAVVTPQEAIRKEVLASGLRGRDREKATFTFGSRPLCSANGFMSKGS